jgi:hypothetical protein
LVALAGELAVCATAERASRATADTVIGWPAEALSLRREAT